MIFRQEKQSLCLGETEALFTSIRGSVRVKWSLCLVLSDHVLICQQFAFILSGQCTEEGDNLIYFRLWQVDA